MKKLFLLGMMLFLLFILGCGSGSGGRIAEQFNPRTGTEGLVFDFIDDAPPPEIFDGSAVPLAIEIENKGAAEVFEGYVSWQIPTEIFEAETALDYFELYGKTTYNPQGEIKQLYYYAEGKRLPPMQEVQTVTVGATICYNYETVLSEEVCVDTLTFPNDAFEKPCTVQDVRSSGQGAPVVITQVEVLMIPKDDVVIPRFRIHIRNKGDGLVINKDEVQTACSAETAPNLYNVIYVEEARLSKVYNLQCSGLQRTAGLGKSYFNINQQEDTIFECEYEQGIPTEKGTFITPLVIKLGYGYTKTASKQINIRSRYVPS